MKKHIAILLLLILTAPHLLRWGIIVQWKINHAYIVANFCENKTKPALKCDGKCYLKKQLAKAELGASPSSPAQGEKAPTVKLFVPAPFLVPETAGALFENASINDRKLRLLGALPLYHFLFSPVFFHPPNTVGSIA